MLCASFRTIFVRKHALTFQRSLNHNSTKPGSKFLHQSFGLTTTTSSVRNFLHRSFSSTTTTSLKTALLVPRKFKLFNKELSLTLAELAGHSSFVLVAISYNFSDMLVLRTLAVGGSSLMLIFTFFHPHGRVLWLPFVWNGVFLTTNLKQIFDLQYHAFCSRFFLADEMKRIHSEHLSIVSDVDFYRLQEFGIREEYKKGEQIFKQGDFGCHVYLIISGKCDVIVDEQLTYQVGEGNFLAEVGLHAGVKIRDEIQYSCSVKPTSDVVLIKFHRATLIKLMSRLPSLDTSLTSILSWDVVNKLKTQRQLITKGVIDNEKLSVSSWHRARHNQNKDRYKNLLTPLVRGNLLASKTKIAISNYR